MRGVEPGAERGGGGVGTGGDGVGGTGGVGDTAGVAAVGGGVELTVVVPAYDEEERLAPTLDAIRTYLTGPESRWGDWELIVVDDGSGDRTREIAAAAAAREPRIHLVAVDRNRGKGHALRLGVLASYGRRVLVTDADLAAPIEELGRLDKALTDGHAAAIGSRATRGATIERRQHRLRELLGRTGNFLIRGIAVPGVRDTQCGFKLFDGDIAREAFAASRLSGWGIDVEILHYLHRTGRPVVEVPVRWAHQDGSKVRPLDYPKVLAELTALRLRGPGGRGGGRPSRMAYGRARRTRTDHGRPRRADLMVGVLFLVLAVVLYSGRWTGGGPSHRYLPDSLRDQNQWEWFFAVTAHHVAHLDNPLFSTLQGFPDGVNLMANTAMLGLSVPFAPVTWLFGPAVALTLVMTLGLAATAFAWYRLILSRFACGRTAAVVGAALAAFAPPMVSHAQAHPNFVVLFMIPLIIERVLRLCESRELRNGVILGLYTAYQTFLGEEPLLLAVLGMLLFLAAYGVVRRDAVRAAWRPLVRGLLVAAAVCLPLVAFPLYWQFFGPGSYKSVLHGDDAGNSPLALLSFAERSLAGSAETADRLAANPTEQNAFYGWPLVALAFAITLRLWERTAVKALAFTAVAAAVLSLGPKIRVPWTDVVLPGPWALLAHRPLFESVIESRVALVCAPALGMLVALAVDRLLATGSPLNRWVGLAAVVAALLPIVPAPLKAVDRAPVPAFFADGTWETYVDTDAGRSLVPAPLPDPGNAEALHWQTAAGLGFRLPGGYFNGPYGDDRTGIYGAPPRWTSNLLREVRYSGRVPKIGDAWRAQARTDLAFWKADVVVLVPQPNDAALRRTLSELLGRPGEWVDGVWIWIPPRGA